MDSRSAQGEKQYQEITWEEAQALWELRIELQWAEPKTPGIEEFWHDWVYAYGDCPADYTYQRYRVEVE